MGCERDDERHWEQGVSTYNLLIFIQFRFELFLEYNSDEYSDNNGDNETRPEEDFRRERMLKLRHRDRENRP